MTGEAKRASWQRYYAQNREARVAYLHERRRNLTPEQKECIARQNKEHRLANPEKYHAASHRAIDTARQLILDAKGRPCADCGMKYPTYVMDFDHVRGKKSFGLAAGFRKTRKAVVEEIAKCDIVCANCHRERTYYYGRKKCHD